MPCGSTGLSDLTQVWTRPQRVARQRAVLQERFRMGNGQAGVGIGAVTKGSPGNDLLSHTATSAVPSALEGLTTRFGMELGVSPPLASPEEPTSDTKYVFKVLVREELAP